MEHDFQNRNELESLDSNYHKQFDSDNVSLTAYPPSKLGDTGPQVIPVSTQTDGNYFNQLMGQMQLMQYSQLQQQINSKKGDGFSLNISKDVFRWLILFIFILILVWLLLKSKDSPKAIRQNPIKKLKKFKKNTSFELEDDELTALDGLDLDG